jgi:predicted O-methyltransferase YrrM
LENKIHFLVGDSKVEVPKYMQNNPDTKFDYILVDGSHDKLDAKIDLEMVEPLVSDGGVIVFDDIGIDGCDLKDVWENFKSAYPNTFDYAEDYNGKGVGYAIKKEI